MADAFYAPVAISGMTIVANVDRQMPFRDPTGKAVPPDLVPADIQAKVGTRLDTINLTPRLLAKALTQSYPFDLAFGAATNVAGNPFDMSRDPDFIAVNPDIKPQGYTQLFPNSIGRMFVTAGLSDSADTVWRYILSDADARNFLAGKPDPWGMVLNAKYRGISLPTNSFPRADLGCTIPSNVPTGFDLPNCTLDVYPYAGSFGSAARAVSRGESGRRDVARAGAVNSYGLSPNQQFGERSLLGLTDTSSAARYDQVTIALRNKAGAFVTPTRASMSAAVSHMVEDSAGVSSSPTSPRRTRPPTRSRWSRTPRASRRGLTANQRADYSRLLMFAASQGQVPGTAAGNLPEGYVPLTPALSALTSLVGSQLSDLHAACAVVVAHPHGRRRPSHRSRRSRLRRRRRWTPGRVPRCRPPASRRRRLLRARRRRLPRPSPAPSVVAVAATSHTPAVPVVTTRLAVGAALVLGLVALLARVLLPWFAPRPPG